MTYRKEDFIHLSGQLEDFSGRASECSNEEQFFNLLYELQSNLREWASFEKTEDGSIKAVLKVWTLTDKGKAGTKVSALNQKINRGKTNG